MMIDGWTADNLISREALKKAFTEECCGFCDNCSHYTTGYKCELIANAPTVIRTERPSVMIDGKVVYITQGHIDAMIEYERKEQVKEVVERFMKSLKEADNEV